MKDFIIFLSLFIAFICIMLIYGARGIVRGRVKIEEQNKAVLGVKVVSFIFIAISLLTIYYLR